MVTLLIILLIWFGVFTYFFFDIELHQDRTVRLWWRFVTVRAVIFTFFMSYAGVCWLLDEIDSYIERKRKRK